MKDDYGVEKFKQACEIDFDEAKAILKEDQGFNQEGIGDICKRDPEACSVYFSKIIGKDFDYNNEVDIGLLMTNVLKEKESCAEMMNFIYVINGKKESAMEQKENVTEEVEKEETVTDEVVEKEIVEEPENNNGDGTAEVVEDVVENNVEVDTGVKNPFKVDTKQYVVFNEMLKFVGNKKEFNVYIKDYMKTEFSLESKKINSILSNVSNRLKKKYGLVVITESNMLKIVKTI